MSTLAVLALLACREPGKPGSTRPEAPAGAPDVVLITVDTTRADRIGAYGYAKALTPTIDALAARGRRYDRAYSPLPLTIPAHASIFTGKAPPHHGIRSNGSGILPDAASTLAEVFDRAGYQTAASVAAFVTTRRWGFDQGFDAYFDDIPEEQNFWKSERPANEVVDDLLSWLETTDLAKPRFVWAHLYDPHYPFFPPLEWRQKVPDRPYDAELAWMDSEIARLVGAFDAEKTVFVVVGDHGEGLGEHSEVAHGLFLYDATQRVPLIMAGPGIEAGVIDEPVGLVDVSPTLLSLVGLPALEGIDGRVAPGDPAKPLYMETYQLTQRFGLASHVGVVDGDEKLIAVPHPELYVASDRAEAENLAGTRPERVAALQGVLDAFGYAPPSGDDLEVDPEVAGQLEALGYTDATTPVPLGATLDDPKDHLDMLVRAQRVDHMLVMGEADELIPTLEALAKEYPGIPEFKNRLSQQYAQAGRLEDALRVVDEALLVAPDNDNLLLGRAGLLAELGRFREAADLFLPLAESRPYAPRIRAQTFRVLMRGDGPEVAHAFADDQLQRHPDDYVLIGAVAVALLEEKGPPDAIATMLELGAKAARPEPDVCFHLAAKATGEGKTDEAIALLERELREYPRNAKAAQAQLRLVARAGDWERTLSSASRAVALMPRSTEAHYWKAQSLFNLKRFDEVGPALEAGLAVDPRDPQLVLLDANLLAHQGDKAAGEKRMLEAKAELERRTAAKREKRPR
ncbi:MAG: sulfatase-like hydrolase/transferase [Alphaproteobacteria bacterium]|nr:sulfatase-like hydrolase/transferase [Alphaproteobacteria bacterium]